MKNVSFCMILIFALLSCENGKRPVNANAESKLVQVDSLRKKIDQLDTEASGFHLKASKGKEGEICLKYRLRYSNADKDFCFKYFDYSEVVFPDTSIGILDGSSFSPTNYYLVRDSILVLPLIGMNNLLSVYVLNLESRQVIGSDIRTSLDLVWIDEKDETFLTADIPGYINDTTYSYKLNKFKIEAAGISLIKTDTVHLRVDLKEDLKVNYGIAKRMLQ